jgi:hypothetical protein
MQFRFGFSGETLGTAPKGEWRNRFVLCTGQRKTRRWFHKILIFLSHLVFFSQSFSSGASQNRLYLYLSCSLFIKTLELFKAHFYLYDLNEKNIFRIRIQTNDYIK